MWQTLEHGDCDQGSHVDLTQLRKMGSIHEHGHAATMGQQHVHQSCDSSRDESAKIQYNNST